jgi:hypothetical protein
MSKTTKVTQSKSLYELSCEWFDFQCARFDRPERMVHVSEIGFNGTVYLISIECTDWQLVSPKNGSFSRLYTIRVQKTIKGHLSWDELRSPLYAQTDLSWSQVLDRVRQLSIRATLDGERRFAFLPIIGDHCERIGREIDAILPHSDLQGRSYGQ